MTKITTCIDIFWTRFNRRWTTISCILLLYAGTASAQDDAKIAGRIVDEQTGEGVAYVHIYTNSLEKGTVTDEKGFFIAAVSRQDTLVFSCVGYHLYRLDVSSLDERSYTGLVIPLTPKTYLLNDVNVTAYPSLEQFKRDVVNLNIEPETKSFSIDIPSGYRKPSALRSSDKGEPTMSITGPFSALYNAFSREAKQNRKLQAYYRQQDRRAEINRKYNLEVVKNVTELSEGEAKRFMEWCTFEDDYILRSSEYELAVAMLKCLSEFHESDTLR